MHKSVAIKKKRSPSAERSNADGVRGNLYLPLAGENGAAIVWKSSNPEVISDEERQNENYDGNLMHSMKNHPYLPQTKLLPDWHRFL